MVDITGGCLCGAVRYRSAAEPVTTRACRRQTRQYFGAGASWAVIDDAIPRIEGQPPPAA